MKYWWKRVVKDYLTFSRRERNGLLILIAIGVLIYFLPEIFKPKQPALNKDDFAKDIVRLRVSIDTASGYNKYRNHDEGNDYFQPKHYNDYSNNVKGELFAFDPNTIDAAGWKRLGLRDKTISTIRKFTSKGFKFRKPEDIKRVYGLKPDEADRLIPFIHIAGSDGSHSSFAPNTYTSNNTYASDKTYPSNPNYPTKSTAPYKPTIIDINDADTSAFISLPGIGSKLAFRIVNFRDKLGGFYSVNQVAETYGVPDSTFQKIKPRLQCNHPEVKKININSADINELKSHPYIRYNIGNAIINFRNQHGSFKSVDDLRQINIITDDVFTKITPYLSI